MSHSIYSKKKNIKICCVKNLHKINCDRSAIFHFEKEHYYKRCENTPFLVLISVPAFSDALQKCLHKYPKQNIYFYDISKRFCWLQEFDSLEELRSSGKVYTQTGIVCLLIKKPSTCISLITDLNACLFISKFEDKINLPWDSLENTIQAMLSGQTENAINSLNELEENKKRKEEGISSSVDIVIDLFKSHLVDILLSTEAVLFAKYALEIQSAHYMTEVQKSSSIKRKGALTGALALTKVISEYVYSDEIKSPFKGNENLYDMPLNRDEKKDHILWMSEETDFLNKYLYTNLFAKYSQSICSFNHSICFETHGLNDIDVDFERFQSGKVNIDTIPKMNSSRSLTAESLECKSYKISKMRFPGERKRKRKQRGYIEPVVPNGMNMSFNNSCMVQPLIPTIDILCPISSSPCLLLN